MSLLIAFEGQRRERELIGKILIAYGELEYALLDILGSVLKDRSAAIRTLYQLRSEAHRLAVAEAISTPAFTAAGLGGQLKDALDALNRCKTIRNQYAHCVWANDKGVLRFANAEEAAKTKTGKCMVVAHPLTITLLRNQYAYFEYTDHLLLWVNQQYKKKLGLELSGPTIPKPKRLPPPKLHSRGEARSNLTIIAGTLLPR